MDIKKILRHHKNNITAVVSLLLLLFLSFELISGKITFAEFGTYVASIAGIVSTIVAFISPDAKSKQVKEENKINLIEELKSSFQPIQDEESISQCDCISPTHCHCKFLQRAKTDEGVG